jgi:dipeptide/tripeptide permease
MSGSLATQIHNERAKLAATWVNNLAAAFVVAGFVAPAVSGQLNGAGRFIVALVWIGIGYGLHSLARAILGGLKE